VEPILSRQEIADLLQAIKSGQVSLDLGDKGDGADILECSPLDLFATAQRNKEEQRVPNFDIILDSYCQNYAITLTNLLQRTFHITRNSIETVPFREFLLSREQLGAIGVLKFSMLKHGALLIFDPNLSFALIEIMLGSSNELDALQLTRSLTKIELNVLKHTMSNACGDIDKALRPLLEEETSLFKVENNPRLVSITEEESEVLVGSFTMTVGEVSGEMNLVFPLSTLEPLREPLRELTKVRTTKQTYWSDIIADEVQEVYTDVIARSGIIELSLREVLKLEAGDVVNLNYDPNRPVQVLVQDEIKFFAQPGTHNGHKAVAVTGIQS
jgi:flagellar motor switch protein FliM